eukprot:scaffold111170_cov30-Tisochrysis_lutea.AAC.6
MSHRMPRDSSIASTDRTSFARVPCQWAPRQLNQPKVFVVTFCHDCCWCRCDRQRDALPLALQHLGTHMFEIARSIRSATHHLLVSPYRPSLARFGLANSCNWQLRDRQALMQFLSITKLRRTNNYKLCYY